MDGCRIYICSLVYVNECAVYEKSYEKCGGGKMIPVIQNSNLKDYNNYTGRRKIWIQERLLH